MHSKGILQSKGLCLKVIAEGVETNQQLECLRRLKCDSYQGYFFSAARPADEFEQLLIDNRRKEA
ncbi:MAG: EAL domain-containing protein [Actinomycetia bacterium]|nr:EAL domain-containing protein [Actinomycetes bacterium]